MSTFCSNQLNHNEMKSIGVLKDIKIIGSDKNLIPRNTYQPPGGDIDKCFKFDSDKPYFIKSDNPTTCYFFDKKNTNDDEIFDFDKETNQTDDTNQTDNIKKVYVVNNKCDEYINELNKELTNEINKLDLVRSNKTGSSTIMQHYKNMMSHFTDIIIGINNDNDELEKNKNFLSNELNKRRREFINKKQSEILDHNSNLHKIERKLEESREKEILQNKITTVLGIIIILFSILAFGLLLYYMLGGSEGIKNIKEKTNKNILNSIFGFNKKITSENKKVINKLF